MRQSSTLRRADGPLLALAHELLDAHRDTVELMLGWADELRLGWADELMLGWADELRWTAHLDYLRALARKAEEILALASRGRAVR